MAENDFDPPASAIIAKQSTCSNRKLSECFLRKLALGLPSITFRDSLRPTFISFLFVFGVELFTSGMCSALSSRLFRSLGNVCRYRGEELQKFSTVLKFTHQLSSPATRDPPIRRIFLSLETVSVGWENSPRRDQKFNASSSTMSLLAKCHAKLSPRLVLIEEFLELQSSVHLRSLFWK